MLGTKLNLITRPIVYAFEVCMNALKEINHENIRVKVEWCTNIAKNIAFENKVELHELSSGFTLWKPEEWQ